MLARRLDPPGEDRHGGPARGGGQPAIERARGRWRAAGRRPTRGPAGPVEWWARPAPGGDEQLWAAVRRVQERRLTSGVSVGALARRAAAAGHPLRRETLSRVLNGAQPTSWRTAEALAHVLGVDLWDLRRSAPDDPDGGAEVRRLRPPGPARDERDGGAR